MRRLGMYLARRVRELEAEGDVINQSKDYSIDNALRLKEIIGAVKELNIIATKINELLEEEI